MCMARPRSSWPRPSAPACSWARTACTAWIPTTLSIPALGEGRPLFRKPLADRSHEHLWVDAGEGYAEPVTPPLQTIAALMQHFLPRANLTLTGGFAHPLKGRQIELIL